MERADLFAPSFRSRSWDAWKVFLRALFALPLDDEALTLYRTHTGRLTPPDASFNEAALVVGRRGGKSRVLALIAVFLACFRDYTPYLAPGEVATIAVIAADRKQARTIFRFVVGLLNAVPMLKGLVMNATDEAIVLSNRVVIEIQTASFRVTRGFSFAAVLCDEIAFWRDETSATPDVEILRAVRPGMASIPGSILLLASSPYRRAGVLWTTYQRHFGKAGARVLVWQAPTKVMNPRIDPEIIAQAYEDDPEAAASEYGAEFRSDIADFVSRSVVEACVEPGCHERAPARATGNRYSMFVDAAGGSGLDSMTCAISHLENGIPVLDAVRERRPPFSPDEVVNEFAALAKSYSISRAESDKWGGDWVGERFRKVGLTVEPCAKPKSQIYTEILPMLNAHRCQLLDHPKMISQFCGLERRTARGGKDSIDHSPGAHDDVCNSVAGALLMVQTAGAPLILSKATRDRMASLPGRDRFARSNNRFGGSTWPR